MGMIVLRKGSGIMLSISTLERVGERLLRAVLPAEEAKACGWGAWATIWVTDQGNIVKQRRTNSCNGAQQCRVNSYGSIYSTSC